MAATVNDNRFSSMLFCPHCAALLDLPGDEDEVICEGCGSVEPAQGKPEHWPAKRLARGKN